MTYNDAVKKIFEYFKRKNISRIKRQEIAEILGIDEPSAYKNYTRIMVQESLLDFSALHYKRNDNVYRLLYGYGIFISRFDENGELVPIELEEWLDYIDSDHEMRHDGFLEATNLIGEYIKVSKTGICVWTSYKGPQTAWFENSIGRIVVKNPDQEIRAKMFYIAQNLNAIVVGEDGESYGEDGMKIQYFL